MKRIKHILTLTLVVVLSLVLVLSAEAGRRQRQQKSPKLSYGRCGRIVNNAAAQKAFNGYPAPGGSYCTCGPQSGPNPNPYPTR